MSSARNTRNEEPTKPSGVAGDISRLKADSAAAVEELREFIGQIHAKSPQEILGAVAQSSLTRGIATSALGVVLLLAAFTIGPFLMNRQPADAGPTETLTPEAAVQPQSDQTQPNNTEPETDAATVANPDKADLEKATSAMGIGEIKTADPDENPLDKKLDSLLDGVD